MKPSEINTGVPGGQRLDHAVGRLLASPRVAGVERLHLRRLAGPGAGSERRFRPGGTAREGLARLLDEHLMPRLQDPSILQRDRFIAILRDIGARLDSAAADDGNRLAAVARAVLDREISRTLNLRARAGEILEG